LVSLHARLPTPNPTSPRRWQAASPLRRGAGVSAVRDPPLCLQLLCVLLHPPARPLPVPQANGLSRSPRSS